MTKEEEYICSLCGNKFIGFGNNSEPLKASEDRCCDECNSTKVIPARLKQIKKEKII